MTLRLSALFEEKMKKISSDFKIGQKFNEKLRRSQRFKRRDKIVTCPIRLTKVSGELVIVVSVWVFKSGCDT